MKAALCKCGRMKILVYGLNNVVESHCIGCLQDQGKAAAKLAEALSGFQKSRGLWGPPASCDGCRYEHSADKDESCHECRALNGLVSMCDKALAEYKETCKCKLTCRH